MKFCCIVGLKSMPMILGLLGCVKDVDEDRITLSIVRTFQTMSTVQVARTPYITSATLVAF